jgi:hypothetical protein
MYRKNEQKKIPLRVWLLIVGWISIIVLMFWWITLRN